MNATENKNGGSGGPQYYWRLWLLDTVLVSGGLLFFLTAQYGTNEFFLRASAMALLPLIPVLVLVGGAGSTIFVLTKAMIDRRGLKTPSALVLLVGPALALTLLLGLLSGRLAPAHQLAYICLGDAPASVSHVRITGFSTFLREEWLAAFEVGPQDFQTMVAKAGLVPADDFEFSRALEQSAVKTTRLVQGLGPLKHARCFQRVFKVEEHKRGRVFMVFDPTTSTALVLREYHD